MQVLIGVIVVLVLAFFAVRWQGQHHPHPMPYWLEGVFLDNPLRRLVFGPGLVLSLGAVRSGDRVAEIGSGIGFISEALSRATGPGGEVLALDQSPMAVAATRRRLSNGPARHSVVEGDAGQLPWDSGSVDVVVMVAMLGEIAPDRRRGVLGEVRRVLAPQGRVVLVEYWPDPHYLLPADLKRYLAGAGLVVEASRRAFLQHGVRATRAGGTDAG
jgi:ubiquinone/menaquinone biosynthesis C-methylase UbiE